MHHIDIARKYNISDSTVHDIYNKKYWKELSKDVVFPKPIKARGRNKKPVRQFDLDNNFIAEHESARDAEIKTNINYKYISKSCISGKSTMGFYFKFA